MEGQCFFEDVFHLRLEFWWILQDVVYGKNMNITETPPSQPAKIVTELGRAEMAKKASDNLRVAKARAPEEIRAYLRMCPISFEMIMLRSYLKEAPPRAAIQAKCLDCVNFVRDEITYCTVKTCPLFEYRPYQIKEPAEDE